METPASESTPFVDIWQSFAFQVPEYSKGEKYSALLALLINVETESEDKTELNLRGNQPLLSKFRLEDEDIAILAKTLYSNKITSLNLSYNSLSDSTIGLLADYIKSSSCSLKILNLSYNDIESTGAEELAAACQLNESISSLLLDGCKIGRKGGICLASMLQVNKTIQRLGLTATDLDTDCIIALATVLRGNKSIVSIDLSRPLLHSKLEEPTIHISKMLLVNSTLKELHLSKHGMTDTGVEWLCRMLRENTCLHLLDISCNNLSRDGARHLSVLLQHNTPLAVLDISYNRVEDEGLVHLSSVLAKTNTTLTSLSVCSNSVGDEGLCALANALHTNATLSKVAIWGNKIQEPTCNAFRELLESRRLQPNLVDVTHYEVDGVTYLARTDIQ